MGVRNSIVLFFSMLFALSSASPKHKNKYKPCKHLVLYFHETVYNGTNAADATSAIVAAPQGANLTILAPQNYFGNIVIFNDPITLDNNIHSKPVGRAQGFYLYDTKDTITAWFGFSFILNSTDYQGSINFIGPNPVFEKTRDISVVRGSGDFFMHRGVATLTTDAFKGNTSSGFGWISNSTNVGKFMHVKNRECVFKYVMFFSCLVMSMNVV